MRSLSTPLLALTLILPTPGRAQAGPEVPDAPEALGAPPSVTEDLAADMAEAGEKLVALARALPPSEWGWRPGPGVRSVAEVVRHVAYDAFYFPSAAGLDAPAGTGITADYATARAWGERAASREETLAALEASLRHLREAVLLSGDATLGEPATIFGRSMDRQELWLLATVHLHEHLGQLIAYARTRGVVPPWSAGDP